MSLNRADFIDELRGLSLLGIVLVNAPFLAISLAPNTATIAMNSFDYFAEFFVAAFAQGKFYLIFSFLFGYSAARFMKTETQEGLKRFRRRLWVLGALGILHGIFFFVGDILLGYALMGAILAIVLQKPDKAVKKLGLWMAGIALLFYALLAFIPDEPTAETIAEAGSQITKVSPVDSIPIPPEQILNNSAPDEFTLQYDQMMQMPNFWEAGLDRAQLLPLILFELVFLNAFLALAMMCLGVLAARKRFLEDANTPISFWKKSCVVGFLIGLPMAVISALNQERYWGTALGFAFGPFLSIAYVSALILMRQKWPNLLSWLRSSGKMSMTVYLFESIMLSALFCGWGLGWFGTLGMGAVTLIAIGCWVVMEGIAILWLNYARQGPFETLVSRLIGSIKTSDVKLEDR